MKQFSATLLIFSVLFILQGCQNVAVTEPVLSEQKIKVSYFDLSAEDQKQILESKVSPTRFQADRLINDILFILNEKQSRFQFVLDSKNGVVYQFSERGPSVWCPNFVSIRDRKTDDVYSANFAISGDIIQLSYPDQNPRYIISASILSVFNNDDVSGEKGYRKDEVDFLKRNLSDIFSSYIRANIIDDVTYLATVRESAQEKFIQQLKMNPLFLGCPRY